MRYLRIAVTLAGLFALGVALVWRGQPATRLDDTRQAGLLGGLLGGSSTPRTSTAATSSAPRTTTVPSTSAPTTSAPTTTALTTTAPAGRATPSASPSSSGAPKLTQPPAAGVPSGTTLTPYSGPTTISADGTVIDGKDISDSLTITGKNVIIRNSWVHGPSGNFWGIYVNGGSATISYTKVSNSLNGITGDNYTASHVEVTALGQDGFKLGNNDTIDASYCHDMTPTSGAHADCAQMEGGEVNIKVTNSWLDGGDNSALMLKPDFGPTTDGPVLIDGNVLGKGNYTLYAVPGTSSGQTYYVHNITISNNQFLRDYTYGPDDVTVPVTWTNNTWFDTGAQLAQ